MQLVLFRTGIKDGRLIVCTGAKRHKRERNQRPLKKISNKPFRERFLFLQKTHQETATSICLQLDWVLKSGPKKGQAEVSRLKRTLGLVSYRSRGVTMRQEMVHQSVGYQLMDAMGMTPADLDEQDLG